MVVTNGTVSKRFDEICQLDRELLKRLIFKFSFHYLEFIRLKLMDRFFENIRKVRTAGCSFTLEVTPNDEVIKYIPEIRKLAEKHTGAPPHVTIARDDRFAEQPRLTGLSEEEHKRTWGVFDSALFDFKNTIFGRPRPEFCYAGAWSTHLNLGTGEIRSCYGMPVIQNIFEHPEEPIHFQAAGYRCPWTHCYNGHAFLTLGCIPEMKTPTYAELRNRRCADGGEWLTPEMKSFLSGKLGDSNDEFPASEKQKKCYRKVGISPLRRLKYQLFSKILWKSKRDYYRGKLRKAMR